MRKFIANGTLGDVYLHLARISKIKDEKVVVHHITRHHFWYPEIKSIYKVRPRTQVFFGHHPRGLKLVDKVKIEGFMDFKFCDDLSKFNLPNNYTVVSIKAGRPTLRYRFIREECWKQIIDENENIVLIGDGTSPAMKHKKVLDLTGKTTLMEAAQIVRQSSKFCGFQGFMAFVACSHKIPSQVYYRRGDDLHAIKMNIRKRGGWGKSIIEERKG